MACRGFRPAFFVGGASPVCSRPSTLQVPARTFQNFARISRHTALSSSRAQRAACFHASTATQPRSRRPTFGAGNGIPLRCLRRNTVDEKNKISYDSSTQWKRRSSSSSAVSQPSFREYMRLVTHPVTIITSTDTNVDEHGGPNSWRGATVSSFNSVTLHPEPYISFNIKKLSSTYDAIRNSNMFAIHVLSETSRAVEMATHFSRGNNAEPFFAGGAVRAPNDPILQPFISKEADGKPWSGDTEGLVKTKLPPVLQWRQSGRMRAVIFAILCEYQPEKTQDVGDHVIVIGKVLHAHTTGTLENAPEESQSRGSSPKTCLTYANGQYCHEGLS